MNTRFILAAIALVSILGQSGAGPALAAGKANCAISAGTNGGHKFATLRCAKRSSPANYVIRRTEWESKNKKAYRELARMAGQRFTCTLTKGLTRRSSARRTITTHYDLSDCR